MNTRKAIAKKDGKQEEILRLLNSTEAYFSLRLNFLLVQDAKGLFDYRYFFCV